MKIIRIILVFNLLFTFAFSTYAVQTNGDRGRWLCKSCELAPPGTAMTLGDLTDATDFIKDTVNAQMDKNNDRWLPNQPITICDGSSCILLTFQVGCSCWLPPAPTFKDNGKGYKNGQVNFVGYDPNGVPNSARYIVFVSTYSYEGGIQQLKTPSVTVTQLDAQAFGLGSGLGDGFEWDGGDSSYPFGGDELTGGADLMAGGGCKVDCPPTTITN